LSYHKGQASRETSSGLGQQIREKEGITRIEKWAKQELTKEEAAVYFVTFTVPCIIIHKIE
jgi:hypothetical protein